jgi:hypothetical protein
MNDHDALGAVRHAARWFTPTADGLAPLLDLIGDARFVALTPLERWSRESSDLPETYPTGV